MTPPPDKKKKTPWATGGGKNVHPKAPAGAGGAGTFTSPKPLQNRRRTNAPPAHPQSPVGKDVVPIDKARADGVPPPPSLDMRALMLAKAKELVGKPIISNIRNDNREECYDMVDEMLQEIGAKSAPEYMKSVGKDDNYVWGQKIELKDIQPGDILQIRNSVLEYTVSTSYKAIRPGEKAPDGSDVTITMERGHHTAVVIAINPDGSFQVSEQHVRDESRKAMSKTIRENTFPLQDIDGEPVVDETTKDSVKVRRTVKKSWHVNKDVKIWAYRAQEKR